MKGVSKGTLDITKKKKNPKCPKVEQMEKESSMGFP
jgi:hypothetical protein